MDFYGFDMDDFQFTYIGDELIIVYKPLGLAAEANFADSGLDRDTFEEELLQQFIFKLNCSTTVISNDFLSTHIH